MAAVAIALWLNCVFPLVLTSKIRSTRRKRRMNRLREHQGGPAAWFARTSQDLSLRFTSRCWPRWQSNFFIVGERSWRSPAGSGNLSRAHSRWCEWDGPKRSKFPRIAVWLLTAGQAAPWFYPTSFTRQARHKATRFKSAAHTNVDAFKHQKLQKASQEL